MTRILAVDYGRARLGIAYSDERRIIASPLKAFATKPSFAAALAAIQQEMKKLGPFTLILIGLPLLLNGEEGEMAKEARTFGELCAKTLGLPLLFWDERLSSAQLEKLMQQDGLSRKKRSQHIDALAATLILQNYLDFLYHSQCRIQKSFC